MKMNFGKFCHNFKIAGTVAIVGAMLAINGCGDNDSNSSVDTNSTQVTYAQAKIDAGGTVTTTAIVTAKAPNGSVAIEIPPDTTITGKDANGNTVAFKTLPVINVSTPTSGMSGMPTPKTGYYISSVAGVVDITFSGFSHVTFSKPVIISIPITDPSKLTNKIAYVNNSDGLGWLPIGPATINAAQTIGTVPVTHLSGYGADVIESVITGSGGSTK